jgi:hypothetical protein
MTSGWLGKLPGSHITNLRVLPRVVSWVRYRQLAANMVQQAIPSPRLSNKGGPLTRDGSLVEQSIELVEALKSQQDSPHLLQYRDQKGQVVLLEGHGDWGCTWQPDSWGSRPVSQPAGWDLLDYLMLGQPNLWAFEAKAEDPELPVRVIKRWKYNWR